MHTALAALMLLAAPPAVEEDIALQEMEQGTRKRVGFNLDGTGCVTVYTGDGAEKLCLFGDEVMAQVDTETTQEIVEYFADAFANSPDPETFSEHSQLLKRWLRTPRGQSINNEHINQLGAGLAAGQQAIIDEFVRRGDGMSSSADADSLMIDIQGWLGDNRGLITLSKEQADTLSGVARKAAARGEEPDVVTSAPAARVAPAGVVVPPEEEARQIASIESRSFVAMLQISKDPASAQTFASQSEQFLAEKGHLLSDEERGALERQLENTRRKHGL